MRVGKETHHFESASDDTFEDLDVRETAFDGFLRQLDKVGQWVVVKNEREGGLGLCCRDRVVYERWCDREQSPERDLSKVER